MSLDKSKLPGPHDYFHSQDIELKGHPRSAWKTARCHFHGGSDSMRINTSNGAWVCMACGVKGGDVLSYHMKANCMDFIKAAQELGAWEDDGKPHTQQRASPLPARSAMQVLAFEATLTAVAAGNVAHGVKLTAQDLARLMTAARRITMLSEAYT